MGTLNMLGLAKRTKARFLISSTSGMSHNPNQHAHPTDFSHVEVYGDPEVHPQPED
jgi:UDP-glucuronate decarboxylase